jgi:hypothetical protein
MVSVYNRVQQIIIVQFNPAEWFNYFIHCLIENVKQIWGSQLVQQAPPTDLKGGMGIKIFTVAGNLLPPVFFFHQTTSPGSNRHA